ncbi:MAG TPA: hypothetical protein VLR26_16160 [Frankiaceae bacterium]|nr:hypothetical protein [Frankiaceae bacterium]
MLPPRCDLCGRKARQGGGRPFGGYSLVQFADHAPQETGGLSEGLSWFCPAHADAARKLTDLSRAAALTRLRADYTAAATGKQRRGWLRRRRESPPSHRR